MVHPCEGDGWTRRIAVEATQRRQEIRMSFTDRFRRQPNRKPAGQAPKPKRLRLAGRICPDDIFPSSTTNEQ